MIINFASIYNSYNQISFHLRDLFWGDELKKCNKNNFISFFLMLFMILNHYKGGVV